MQKCPRKLRVAIVAEHASARFGGEAILPLHYFRVLRSRGIDAWLITHARTREELLQRFGRDAERIWFVPDTCLHRLLNRIGQHLPGALRYFTAGWLSRLITQMLALRLVRRLVRRHRIDVVHQPIPVSPRESSLLYNLGAPLVVGPMNGGMSFPPGFEYLQKRGVEAFVRLGRLSSGLVNRLIPGKRRAAILLVANPRTREALADVTQGRVMTLVENGVDLGLWPVRTDSPSEQRNGPVRFVFMGRLIDWKGVDLLLQAFSPVRGRVPASLEVIGDGPMAEALKQQARRLGLGAEVRFSGWLPQEACGRRLQQADVFVLPSLYECGGAVVLEAMAVGLPVIATRWGGPADYIDESCGILVDPTSKQGFVDGLSAAMLRLAEDEPLRRRMGRAGRDRVLREFDWERKVDRMLEIYAQAVSRGAEERRSAG